MFGSPSADVNNRQRLAVIDFMLCTPRFTLSDLVSRTRLDATVVHSVVNEVQDHLTQVGTRDLTPQLPASIEYRAEASLLDVRLSLDKSESLTLSGFIRNAGIIAALVNYREKVRASIRRLEAIAEHLQRAVTLLTRHHCHHYHHCWHYRCLCYWCDINCSGCGVDMDEVTEVLRRALELASPSICTRNCEESFPAISALLEEAVDLASRRRPVSGLFGTRDMHFPPDGLLTLVREALGASRRRTRNLVNAENSSYSDLPLRSVEYAGRPDLAAITFLLKEAISQTESSASHCQGWWSCHSASVVASLRNALRSVEAAAGLPTFSSWGWYLDIDCHTQTVRGITRALDAVERVVSDHSRSTCWRCQSSLEGAVVQRCSRIVVLMEAFLAEHAALVPEWCSGSLEGASLFGGRVPARSYSMTHRDDTFDRPLLSLSEMDHLTLRDAYEGTVVTGTIGSGKTTAVGWQLAYQLATRNMGGLICTAKAEETNSWRAYAKAHSRENDLVVFWPESRRYFDPLYYEWARPETSAGEIESIVDFLFSPAFVEKEETGRNHDSFWERASEQLVRNCIRVLCWSETPIKLLPSQTRLALALSARRFARGAGATFPDSVYEEWIAQCYNGSPNRRFAHDPIGSEGGIRSFLRSKLDFAGCDWPLTPEYVGTAIVLSPRRRLYLYIPSAAYTVASICRSAQGTPALRLSRGVLAAIFRGEIRSWDDPVILCENLGLPPGSHIKVIRRNDSSGTTLVLTTFLNVRGNHWRLGTGLKVNWPVRTNAAIDGSGGTFPSGPFNRLFCGDLCDFIPDDTTRSNKIIICDFPMLKFGYEFGRVINVLPKPIWERTWIRHELSESAKPVFLWQDEFQYFVRRRDNFFQQTCRASHDAVACLIQNAVNLSEALRGDRGSKDASLPGNLAMKVFHQWTKIETFDDDANPIGKQYRYLGSFFARLVTSGDVGARTQKETFCRDVRTVASELGEVSSHSCSEAAVGFWADSSSWRGLKPGEIERGNGVSSWLQTGWNRIANTLDEGLGVPGTSWENSTWAHREWISGFFATSNTNDFCLRTQRSTGGPSPGRHRVGSTTLNRDGVRSGLTAIERMEVPGARLTATETCLQGNVQ